MATLYVILLLALFLSIIVATFRVSWNRDDVKEWTMPSLIELLLAIAIGGCVLLSLQQVALNSIEQLIKQDFLTKQIIVAGES